MKQGSFSYQGGGLEHMENEHGGALTDNLKVTRTNTFTQPVYHRYDRRPVAASRFTHPAEIRPFVFPLVVERFRVRIPKPGALIGQVRKGPAGMIVFEHGLLQVLLSDRPVGVEPL